MPGTIEVSIRRATPRDKRAVSEICRHIWGGSDYVPGVFDQWVRDRRGGLWLAIVGGRSVGVAKLTLLGDHEAWLHALRVHPRYRRRGVARALIAHRLERAKQLGALIARLDTSDDNVAVHRLMRRFGFRRVSRYAMWNAPARRGPLPRQARPRELENLLRLAPQSDGLLHESFVRRRLDPRAIACDIRTGWCYVAADDATPHAMVVLEPYEDRLRMRVLAGSGTHLVDLLRELPALAAAKQKRRVGMTVEARHWRALRAAGYRRPWRGAMLLFEKRL